jgi:hypothetical protein
MQPTITHMDGSITDRTRHLPKPSIHEALHRAVRFCQRSAQPGRTEPYGPASTRMTGCAFTLLSSPDPAQMNESGRIWMAATRLKP